MASRRAGARPPDRLGRKGQEDESGDAAAAPRSLEPVRPWLTGESPSTAPGEQHDGIEGSNLSALVDADEHLGGDHQVDVPAPSEDDGSEPLAAPAEPEPNAEPFPAAAESPAAESSPVGTGTDLPRRLAAANAAAKGSPPVTGTAFATRNFPPADVDGDEPRPGAAKRRRVTLRGMIRLVVVLVIATLIATLLRTYVVAPYYIPSASMEPTLHGCTGCNKDHVLVDKLSYKMHDIHRGDVVVFRRPKTWQVSEKVLIKRVVGLPGDTLTARNGIVYVDGLALDEPYLDKECQSGTTNFPLAPLTVPDGQAWVMGDNRCDSSDSRRFGAIADSAVIGRAALIIWPLGRLHWL